MHNIETFYNASEQPPTPMEMIKLEISFLHLMQVLGYVFSITPQKNILLTRTTNLVRMCIGIISWTGSIASHITLVTQELSPFNDRNYLTLVLSTQ